MLQRVRELAVQYKNGTLSATDRTAIQSEANELQAEIERIGQSAQFNGIKLLNQIATVSFQVGANDGETIAVTTISLGQSVDANTSSLRASDAISQIDQASRRCPPSAPRSARCRTASSTR